MIRAYFMKYYSSNQNQNRTTMGTQAPEGWVRRNDQPIPTPTPGPSSSFLLLSFPARGRHPFFSLLTFFLCGAVWCASLRATCVFACPRAPRGISRLRLRRSCKKNKASLRLRIAVSATQPPVFTLFNSFHRSGISIVYHSIVNSSACATWVIAGSATVFNSIVHRCS